MSGEQVEAHKTATAAELAELLDVSVHEVHCRASRGAWRRTKTRPVRYLLADVVANDDTRRSRRLAS